MDNFFANLQMANPYVQQLMLEDLHNDDQQWDAAVSFVMEEYRHRFLRNPFNTSALTGAAWVTELLEGAPERCFRSLRMYSDTFRGLCYVLKTGNYYVSDLNQTMSIEESVAIFISVVSTRSVQRTAGERFQRSLATISHHVKKVCIALQGLGTTLIKPRKIGQTPSRILNDPKMAPYFQNCMGAIDGTLIPVSVPANRHVAFRSRHGTLTQNVLAICDWDMYFTFVNAGFEGSAHDGRVLRDTAIDPTAGFPMPLPGWFYFVDSGYTNTTGFLAPYKGDRYHIQEWQGRASEPTNARELFNRRHASLRNVIERCFGVLKNRFQMLIGMTSYRSRRQGAIVMACCCLHNFIREYGGIDQLFTEYWDEMHVEGEGGVVGEIPIQLDLGTRAINAMGRFRDDIAARMWSENH